MQVKILTILNLGFYDCDGRQSLFDGVVYSSAESEVSNICDLQDFRDPIRLGHLVSNSH